MAVNGLEKITDKILNDAREEAARILAEAEESCRSITEGYTARADAIKDRLVEEAKREGADLVARAKTTAVTKRKNATLEAQSRLIDETFTVAYSNLKRLPVEEYRAILVGLLSSALYEQDAIECSSRALYGEEEAALPASYEVLFNARDRERCGKDVLDATVKKLNGRLPAAFLKKLKLSEQTRPIDGGLILRCGDVESNCSLELLFAQLREELEVDVYRALFVQGKRA